MDLTDRARALARLHFEEEFNIRLIIDELFIERAVYFWNNCPAKGSISIRDAQVEQIRQECAKVGMSQAAYVEHPERGADEGYSCLAIFSVPPEDDPRERRKWLSRLCKKLFSQSI